jgi:hypothetical protein
MPLRTVRNLFVIAVLSILLFYILTDMQTVDLYRGSVVFSTTSRVKHPAAASGSTPIYFTITKNHRVRIGYPGGSEYDGRGTLDRHGMLLGTSPFGDKNGSLTYSGQQESVPDAGTRIRGTVTGSDGRKGIFYVYPQYQR